MTLSKIMICAALGAAAIHAQDQNLLSAIADRDRVVTDSSQTLTGTWLLELRRPGTAADQPGIPLLVVYQPDGTVIGSGSDGAQSSHAGVWVRVGDRRFVQTMYLFTFNEARALAGLTKVRINVLLAEDGRSLKGTTEIVALDRQGKVLATIPGTTYTGVRLSAEKTGDFEAFQNQQ
jgi:hypothetical protein